MPPARDDIGIALYPEHAMDAVFLLRQADVAMYAAKRRRREVAMYGRASDENSAQRLQLIGELWQAIERDELRLHCQPKMETRTGVIQSVEALVRQHPLLGLLSPDRFVPLAEENGMIRELTRWVLNAVLAQSRAWHDAGISLPIAVNLSAHSFCDQELVETVTRLFERWRVPVGSLEVEIRETVLMTDRVRAVAVLGSLRRLGVRVALDDFGTGNSSLAYTCLRHLGCDLVQGFHLGRPMEAELLSARIGAEKAGRGVAMAVPV